MDAVGGVLGVDPGGGQTAGRDQFLHELCERYDLDGLELDWNRWVLHFRPGWAELAVQKGILN